MAAILQPGKNCWTIGEVFASGLLIDGRDYYKAFYRAAMNARNYILLTGWQFDRSVPLLRGDDAGESSHDVRFLSFLNGLCENNPELRIYILAWDFSSLYILDREWFQDLLYSWTTSDRLTFRFDNTHPIGASHHQKFAVIDGAIAFAGGLDICSRRWDDREHRASNSDRWDIKGKPYEPYHDIQCCFTGPAAEILAGYFSHRWMISGGKRLNLPPPPHEHSFEIEPTVSILAHRVAFSRTRGRTLLPLQGQLQEIRNLYVDAIGKAEQLIYMENQFFSSEAVYRAIIDRIGDPGRPLLQIVIVLPKKPHTLAENIAMGVAQMKMLKDISEKSEQYGHSIGIYYTLPASEGPEEREEEQWESTYIHAKLLIVDDRFLSVGSANTTNRSMGLDTELNVSWEEGISGGEELTRSIRRIREALIAEHAGLEEEGGRALLESPDQLVARLDGMCGKRLKRRTTDAMIEENPLLKTLDPEKLKVDPEKPVVEETVFEVLSLNRTGLFAEGIEFLSDTLAPEDVQQKRLEKKLQHPLRRFLSGFLSILRNPWRWLILLALLILAGMLLRYLIL